MCRQVNSALRTLIVEAVSDCYINALQDTATSTYSGVMVRQFQYRVDDSMEEVLKGVNGVEGERN